MYEICRIAGIVKNIYELIYKSNLFFYVSYLRIYKKVNVNNLVANLSFAIRRIVFVESDRLLHVKLDNFSR